MNFPSSWLRIRRKHDEAARNPQILQRVLTELKTVRKLEIWDLGAGICNTAFFFPFFFAKHGYTNQRWLYIERDPLLKNDALENLKHIFPGLSINNCYQHLDCCSLFKSREGLVFEGHYIVGDINILHSLVSTNPTIIMANALFDILPPKLVNDLIFRFQKCIWYSSLNHKETNLFPEENLVEISRIYDQHTICQAEKRMGIKSCEQVPEMFYKHGFEVWKAPSYWNIHKSKDPIMFENIWAFIDEVVREYGIKNITEAKTICNRILISHCDLLAVPKTR